MSRLFLGTAITMVMACTFAVADDTATDEGLKQGEAIGVFYVTKVAGAEDDEVELGDDLCYRCRYGSSPMVMVFARQTGGKVSQLVKELDEAITANEDAKLKGLLTLLGDDAAALKEDGKKIAAKSGAKKVPVVVAKDTKTGPLSYRLPTNAEVTIVVAKDSQVVATHIFAADKIDVAAVMREVKQMLN